MFSGRPLPVMCHAFDQVVLDSLKNWFDMNPCGCQQAFANAFIFSPGRSIAHPQTRPFLCDFLNKRESVRMTPATAQAEHHISCSHSRSLDAKSFVILQNLWTVLVIMIPVNRGLFKAKPYGSSVPAPNIYQSH